MHKKQPKYSAIYFNNREENLLKSLQLFRKRLFVDELKWKLTTQGCYEIDEFDTEDADYCVLFAQGEIVGGFRAIRTDSPYLANTIFPHLATLRSYPARPDVWEISRFGILAQHDRLRLARINYALMFNFALNRDASALVAVADLTYERYLAHIGIRSRRYGPPQIIGTDQLGRPMQVVAGEIRLNEQHSPKFLALLKSTKNMEVKDETLARRPERVSA